MLSGLVLLLAPGPWHLIPAIAQQPQAQQGQPISALNAKFVNGVAPGYWPTSGTGLTLNLSAGTSVCGNLQATYAGGTLTLTANATNYVFLDSTNGCVPALATGPSGFPSTGIPLAIVSTNSSAITGLSDARTWFAARPVADKGGQVYNVKAYGATGNGTTDDTAAIQAANTAACSAGGIVYFPPGQYVTSSPITVCSYVYYEGAVNDTAGATQGTTISNNASDVFNLSANLGSARFEHFNVKAGASAGHIFNLQGYGAGGTTWNDVTFNVGNTGKSAIYSVCSGTSDCHTTGATTFLGNVLTNLTFNYGANTVPVVYLQNATINTDTFANFWFTGSTSSASYAFWAASTANPYVNFSMDHATFEVCYGGAINLEGANGVLISNSGVYDTGVAVNPQVNLAANTVGGESNFAVKFTNSNFGSATSFAYPDLYLATGALTLDNSGFNYAVSPNAGTTVVGEGASSAIGHAQNIALINYAQNFTNGNIVNPLSVYGLQTTAVSGPPSSYGPSDVSSASATWQASTAYCWNNATLTQAVIWDGSTWQYYTGCGTSGGTAPTWNHTAGATTTDGTAIATCLGNGGSNALAANTTYYLAVATQGQTGTSAIYSPASALTTANDGAHHLAMFSHSTYTGVAGQTGLVPACTATSGNWSNGLVPAPYTGAYTGLPNYIFPVVACGGGGAAPTVDTSGSISTPGNATVGLHLNQTGANKFAGQCTMASASSCTFSLSAAYTGTPVCITTPQGTSATYYGACSVSGNTVTITASGSNSLTWGAILVGNPN